MGASLDSVLMQCPIYVKFVDPILSENYQGKVNKNDR